jgi:hypothetical protein
MATEMVEDSHSIVDSEASVFFFTVSSEYGKADIVHFVLQWVPHPGFGNGGTDVSI